VVSVISRVSSLIISVVKPVETGLLNIGQWIMISGIVSVARSSKPLVENEKKDDADRQRHPILEMDAENRKFSHQPLASMVPHEKIF